MSPRFFLLCLLSLGVSAGASLQDEEDPHQLSALQEAKIHKEAVMEAYSMQNDTAIEELMNRHGVYLPLYQLHQLDLVVARYRSYNENYAFGKFEEHMYLMHLDRKDTSSTGWYMSRLIQCEKNVC